MAVHLHVHSTYSFLDGYGTPEQYAARLKEIGHKAMAVTDHGNIYAHRAFAPVFAREGLKLIYGCELYLKNTKRDERYYHVTVLAANNDGYRNLCKLVSMANRPDHFDRRPQVSLEELWEYRHGLIILSGCFGDGIPHRAYKRDSESVPARVRAMARLFCDVPFFLEVQHIDKEELEYMRIVARMLQVRVCPTVDAHYPRQEDYAAEDLMLCIGQQEKMANLTRMRLLNNLWLMSDAEMLQNGFTAEELATTEEIANMCSVDLPKVEPVQVDGAREQLIKMVREGARRLGDEIRNDTYRNRYLYEMSVIDKLRLHSYFVVMGDVINFFKARGMFIGPARGSSAGSLIAYLIGITEVDPIKYGLSFERFLDINRKDYPDIDTDFPHDQRERVVAYLRDRYGADRVGRLCSFTSYRGSSVFWDIARVYGIGADVARQLGRAIPPFINDEIDMADILAIPEVTKVVQKWPEFGMALALEGQIRQLGKHASGFAVSPVPLTDICAENLSGGETVLSLDKYMAEEAGLLKLDILGLTTLDMVQDILTEVGLKNTDIYRMKPDDPEVYEAFNNGLVAGVFQFEGGAVRRALNQFKVEDLEDLAFINAVARPGASEAMKGAHIPDCLRQFVYKGRYFVYQEELMAILRFLDFDWADVTKFRKLVSRKKATEMEQYYKLPFITRLAAKCGRAEAEAFWELVLRTGSYSFNKSHAVAYAILAYAVMWLKLRYPDVFVKHYLNRTGDDEKRRAIVREFTKKGYKYVVYQEGKSHRQFRVEDRTIIGGLTAIKGIGEAKAAAIERGVVDRGAAKAIEGASREPARYAPWAALDQLGNRYQLGDLPEGEYIIKARVWAIKDNVCVMEDANGAEKAYFDPNYVKLEEGRVYSLAITKYRYARIDNARLVVEPVVAGGVK